MALPPVSPGSTCLVTGASSGIGADLAREFAARDYGVTLVARREERLRALAEELTSDYRVRAETIGCDVTDPEGRRRLEAELADRGLTVETLVNNAGCLQNRQGGAALRLDGSIPSPLREAKCLHRGVFL